MDPLGLAQPLVVRRRPVVVVVVVITPVVPVVVDVLHRSRRRHHHDHAGQNPAASEAPASRPRKGASGYDSSTYGRLASSMRR
ncbi:hypothetical protein F5Y19DRAFT_478777 [Xylariaceae sp. FL1651]|nr:hypothetical protein F5Y19DRAFT_478777 [Xylariaceae sp. FL1651]